MTAVATSAANDRLMLMSIRPRHVMNILAGRKTVELRRSRPAIGAGQPAAIYATLPEAAIVALCIVEDIEIDSPEAVWQRVGSRTGIELSEYQRYFQGAQNAVALHLSRVVKLDEPVSLGHLRVSGTFQPPQTWHFLDAEQIERLVGDHPARGVVDGWYVGGSAPGLVDGYN